MSNRKTQSTVRNTNKQKAATGQSKMKQFLAFVGKLVTEGYSEEKAHSKTSHSMSMYGGGENPIFIPTKHPKMSYANQQRNAKRKKKAK